VKETLVNSFKRDHTATLQSIILPLVWYDRETWSLMEKLRQTEGKLRKIFGSHKDEQKFSYLVNWVIL